MKNLHTALIKFLTATSLFALAACSQNKHEAPAPFRLPKVPLVFKLSDEYLKPDSVDTVNRVDSLGQRMSINIHTVNKKDFDLWRVDTMQFRNKLYYSDWEGQKSGFYWLIQGPSISPNTKRDKAGREVEIYERLDEHFMLHLVRQPEKGYSHPFIDYKLMDEYWSSIRADAAGIANPIDGELFVMAYPIHRHLRGPNQYQKLSFKKDSVAVPFYYDKVDSSQMICLRISVTALNN